VADLGFDDTSLHGSAQIPTPQLRLLAQRGALLMQHYSMPVCTPTRSAILTGVHPIHSGMQCGALLGQQKLGLPLRFKLLPQMLAESLNYEAMAVGKCAALSGFDPRQPPL
jgi:arylsulfatase B